METIDVGIHIQAPIEQVWDSMAIFHEEQPLAKEVKFLRILKEGPSGINGVGTVREAKIGMTKFVEEIVAFDPPNYFEYRVRKSTVPMKHDLGCFKFESTNGGTDVRWISRFELPWPVIGKMMEKYACRNMGNTFLSILKQIKAYLEA